LGPAKRRGDDKETGKGMIGLHLKKGHGHIKGEKRGKRDLTKRKKTSRLVGSIAGGEGKKPNRKIWEKVQAKSKIVNSGKKCGGGYNQTRWARTRGVNVQKKREKGILKERTRGARGNKQQRI